MFECACVHKEIYSTPFSFQKASHSELHPSANDPNGSACAVLVWKAGKENF